MSARAATRRALPVPACARRWVELREAVREATALGAKFRVFGNTVEIDGQLPEDLRARLDLAMLRSYLPGSQVEAAEVDFFARIFPGIAIVMVEDAVGLAAAMNALGKCPVISIDLETAPVDYRPAPVRINKDGSVSASQPAPELDGLCPHRANIQLLQAYGGTDKVYLFRGSALNQLIHSEWLTEQHLTAHSSAFELAFLWHHAGFVPKNIVECTAQASGLIHGLNRSLTDTAYYTLGTTPPKGLAQSPWNAPKLSPAQTTYAATDVVLGLLCWEDLRHQLHDTGREEVYRLQRDASFAAAVIQTNGMLIDLDEHHRITDVWASELAEARSEYHEITGEAPPVTPADVARWLERVAGNRLLGWPRTPGTGAYSTRSKHLKRLILSGEPTVKSVLRMLAKQKLLSTFGARLRDKVDHNTGRLHAVYHVAATKSGRLSCSRPNLQQLPDTKSPEFKGCIVTPPGRLFVGGDWSQLELRIAAWLYDDPVMTAIFASGRDLHAETAAAVALKDVAEVTDDERRRAKAVNFGSLYGISSRGLAETAFSDFDIDMTQEEAQQALNRFASTYATLTAGMADQVLRCKRRGYIEIGLGRVVKAEWQVETNGHLTDQQCKNLGVQGLGGDAMLRLLPMVHHRLIDRRINGVTVATIHDELLLEVAEEDAEAAAAILKECMIECFTLTCPGAPVTGIVTVKIGKTWRELK